MIYSEECTEMANWVASSHRVVPGSNRSEVKTKMDEQASKRKNVGSDRMRSLL